MKGISVDGLERTSSSEQPGQRALVLQVGHLLNGTEVDLLRSMFLNLLHEEVLNSLYPAARTHHGKLDYVRLSGAQD